MNETFIATLTAPGRSALATLACKGPDVWSIVKRYFRSSTGTELPEVPRQGRFWLGRMGDDLADEVVLAVRATDPTVHVEIHGHGGREIARYLVELCVSAGARQVSWEDFIAVGEDSPETLAWRLLPRATTLRTAAILLDQAQGAFSRDLAAAHARLATGDVESSRRLLRQLLDRWTIGRHLVEPFRVVIAGAPNVGKSSLVNALAGYQRSIVAPTPGTTRDLVTTELAIDGWPITLTDTAGIRQGGETLEALGIDQARAAASVADLCLWLVDASTEPVWPAESPANVRVIVNKIDLPPAWDVQSVDALRISAAQGEGIAQLCEALSRWLVPEVPPAGAGVPLTTTQVQEITEASRGSRSPDDRNPRPRECPVEDEWAS